jgi:hypothetical protein
VGGSIITDATGADRAMSTAREVKAAEANFMMSLGAGFVIVILVAEGIHEAYVQG